MEVETASGTVSVSVRDPSQAQRWMFCVKATLPAAAVAWLSAKHLRPINIDTGVSSLRTGLRACLLAAMGALKERK